MAKLIDLQTIQDQNGKLTVFEKILPQGIKRLFYMYDTIAENRGGHRHKKSKHALICIKGNCTVYVNDGVLEKEYILDSPDNALLLNPQDWRELYDFSDDCILLCIFDQCYEPDDYIYERY